MKVELNLDFEEYRYATNALGSIAYERLKLAEYDTHKSQEHLEIAEALAKARHEIAVQVGLDDEGLDPVSEAVLEGWKAYHSPIEKMELQLTSNEYIAIVSGLTELVNEKLQFAEVNRPSGYGHIEVAEALAKGRHQIALQLGIDEPGETDPVSAACQEELAETRKVDEEWLAKAVKRTQALDKLVDSWYKRFDLEEMREGAKFVEKTFGASTTTHDLKSEIADSIRQDLGNGVDPELADHAASKILQLIGKGWTDADCMQELDEMLESSGQRPQFQDVSVGTFILFDYGFYRKTSETEARMIDCVHPETFLGDAFTVAPEKRVFLSLAMR